MLGACPAPVLLLQGERDCQIRMADFEALRGALEAREGVAFEAHTFPELNHLFMPCEDPSTGAEYFEAGHVDPEVSAVIAAWVRRVSPAR